LIVRADIETALPLCARIEAAHYTRIGNLVSFLCGKGGWCSAWATPVQFLNDRMELSLGLKALALVANSNPPSGKRVRWKLDELMTSIGELETDAFQMSFSGNPDELGQWRGYAANGFGCSVITTTPALHSVADVSGWVVYEPKRQHAFAYKVLDRLRKVDDELRIARTLVAAASFMKHPGFSPEAEYRILRFPREDEIGFRESGNRLVPYFDFLKGRPPLPVEKVVIGPGWQLAALSPEIQKRHHVPVAIYRLLSARGLQNTIVESSALPYDPT
jgi:hypothetical protein